MRIKLKEIHVTVITVILNTAPNMLITSSGCGAIRTPSFHLLIEVGGAIH